eukprot:SAG22_NODE_396_length_11127_cov_33.460011_10_plen_228_part_00
MTVGCCCRPRPRAPSYHVALQLGALLVNRPHVVRPLARSLARWLPVPRRPQYRAAGLGSGTSGDEALPLSATPPPPPQVSREIIGAVSAVIMDITSCPPELPRPPANWPRFLGGPAPSAMYIKTLGVRDSHRRCGLARQLVMACEQHAIEVGGRECGLLWLHVIAWNTAAMRLYEKCGFVQQCFLPAFYHIQGKREDAHLYVKFLPDGPSGCEEPRWSSKSSNCSVI